MSNNFTGRPRSILNGTDDQSGRINVDVLQNIAGFNPLIFLLTERGPEGTHDLDSVGGINAYGTESLRTNSPFATHQTELAKSVIAFAPTHIHRVRLPGARRSIFRVSAELATVSLPVYLRDALGNIQYSLDELGIAQPVIDGYTVGSRIVLHYGSEMYPESQRDFGKAQIVTNFRAGDIEGNVDDTLPEPFLSFTKSFVVTAPTPTLATPTNFAGMTTDEVMRLIDPANENVELETGTLKFHSTTLFPLFESELGYFGSVGDKFGFILDDLIATTNGNVSTMWEIENFLYQLRLVEIGKGGTAKIINTIDGDRTVNVTIAETSYSERFNADYTWAAVTAENYADIGLAHHYSGSVEALTKMLIEGYTLTDGTVVEGELSRGDDGMLSRGAINILGGVDANNKPYKTLRLQDSVAFGGSNIGGNYPIMGSGGSDGLSFDDEGRPNRLKNLMLFDEEVRRQLENFGDLEDQLLDIPRFPITTLVDTGFSSETKDAMVVAFNRRPDIYSIFTTFRVADYTEPEPPPKPTPRPSIFHVVRPPQSYINENIDTVIQPKFLSYLIEKTETPGSYNVTIVIDKAAGHDDLFMTVELDGQPTTVRRNIPLGFALSNRDYVALLNIEDKALEVAKVTVEFNGEQSTSTISSAEIKTEFRYPVGTQHASIATLRQNDVINPDYSGAYVAGKTLFSFDMDFDGEDIEGDLYLRTPSTVNVTIVGTAQFMQDEEYIVLAAAGDSVEAKRFDINISGKDYKNISATDIVTAVNREGLGTEARLFKVNAQAEVESNE